VWVLKSRRPLVDFATGVGASDGRRGNPPMARPRTTCRTRHLAREASYRPWPESRWCHFWGWIPRLPQPEDRRPTKARCRKDCPGIAADAGMSSGVFAPVRPAARCATSPEKSVQGQFAGDLRLVELQNLLAVEADRLHAL
jgi:hypothetical protein